MGLYDSVPDSFSGQAGRELGSAFSSLPGLQRSKLEADAMRQQNVDQAYNSPARPANSYEQQIGNHYRRLMGHDNPNIPPEWRDRLMREFNSRGLQSPAVGVQQPPVEQPQYSGPGARDQWGPPPQSMAQPMEQTPSRFNAPPSLDFAVSMPITDSSERNYLSDTTGLYSQPGNTSGMERPPNMERGMMGGPNFAQGSMPQKLNRPDASMTNGDVNKFMSMAGTLAPRKSGLTLAEQMLLDDRKTSNDQKLEETKDLGRGERLNTTEGGKDTRQGDKVKSVEELAKQRRALDWQIALLRNKTLVAGIAERVAANKSTAQDRQLLMQTMVYIAQSGNLVKGESSIPSLARNPEIMATLKELELTTKQTLLDWEKRMSSGPKTSGTEGESKSTTIKMKFPNGMIRDITSDKVESATKKGGVEVQ